jgi:hypothetical protein
MSWPARRRGVTLVHLVRAANAPAAFAGFVAALRRCPPGGSWELVLALKGFTSQADTAPYLALADDFDPEPVLVSDEAFDVGAYMTIADRLRRDRYCFLNSWAEPLIPGWLDMLDAALSARTVGLVGATGSWNSSRSLASQLVGFPSPYRGLLPERRVARKEFAALAAPNTSAGPPAVSRLGWLRAGLTSLCTLPRQLIDYGGFPNPHIRTNGFMISHHTLTRVQLPVIRDKPDAYRFESGRRGLTRQVLGLGLDALVVDRDGVTYEPARWAESHTLWQGDQERLMMADNQTRSYAEGGTDRRRLLSTLAWGPSAQPRGAR